MHVRPGASTLLEPIGRARRLKWLSTREHVVYRHTYPSLCDCHSAVCTTRCVWCLEVSSFGKRYGNMPYRPREAVESLRLTEAVFLCYLFFFVLSGGPIVAATREPLQKSSTLPPATMPLLRSCAGKVRWSF